MGAANTTDATEATKTTDATEATKTTDATKATDITDETKATDVTDETKATDIADATNISKNQTPKHTNQNQSLSTPTNIKLNKSTICVLRGEFMHGCPRSFRKIPSASFAKHSARVKLF